MVLEVVTADDNNHAVGELSALARSSNEAMSLTWDVASLRIGGSGDSNQPLVMGLRELSSENVLQQTSTSINNPLRLEAGNNMAQAENLHQVQLQMDELVGRLQKSDQKMEEVFARIQQIDQQREHTQQQTQDQIDRILQTLQQMDRQHTDAIERQQQIEKSQQLDQDSRQQIQHVMQHVQRQIDKVIIDVQELSEQVQYSQPQSPQMSGIGEVQQGQDHLSPRPRSQETRQAFNQFVHAQCLIQAVLTKPSDESPVPRLFIILPGPDKQGGSCSIQFRLYFLCECGSHTMNKDCSNPHEVHLADHPGYDLNNQDRFISKYGRYLLTMMYMVKHGAKARGLVVPPLLGLNHATGDEGIGQLVDDTITHLKEAAGATGWATTAQQGLDVTELTALKSYLKAKGGENFSGGLSQIKIQKAHYAWICVEHLRECYESTLQQLRNNIDTSSGVWHGNEVKVKVTSEETARQFYENLGKLFNIQSVENWRSIKEMDFRLDSYRSASSSTTHTLGGLDDFESLSLDFGRYTMSAKDIFQGDVKDVAISIGNLSAPTLADLEFIQQCRPSALVILETPQKADDDRLVSLLQNNFTTLRIDCDVKRFMDVIDLVNSARKDFLENRGLPAMRMFELVHPEIKVCLSNQVRLLPFEMESTITLEDRQPTSAVYNFIRQRGSSVTKFVAPGSFSDHLASLLDESTQTRSRIAHLDITSTSLTTPGLEAISRVIRRSGGLTYLRLSMEKLHKRDQMAKALFLLEQHEDQLTSLRLEGGKTQDWLAQLAPAFPSFPRLKELFVESHSPEWLSSAERQWIISMASQPQTSLKVLGIGLHLRANGWEALIKAIDLSTLEELHITSDYFYQEQLKVLMDVIVKSRVSSLPMRVLDVEGKEVKDSNTTREMFARIQEKAPQVKVQCNDWTLEAVQ